MGSSLLLLNDDGGAAFGRSVKYVLGSERNKFELFVNSAIALQGMQSLVMFELNYMV